MMKRFTSLLFLMIVFACCTPPVKRSAGTFSVREASLLRIRVIASADKIMLSSKDRMRIYRIDGGEALFQAAPSSSGAAVSKMINAASVKEPVCVESWDNIVSVDGVSYRGKIQVYLVFGKIDVVNIVSMDEYLCGVVPSEMSASWPQEALKAQAVAARTYAYYHIDLQKNSLYDLDASTKFQVYKGVSVENPRSSEAVRGTSGEILEVAGKPILAFFHSTCGGRTCSNQNVWSGEALAYLQSVKCDYCGDSPKFAWKFDVTAEQVRKSFSKLHPGITKVTNMSFKKLDGRAVEVVIKHTNGSVKLTGNEFRMILGPDRIKSLMFTVRKNGNNMSFDGKGWGHGVGMCQYGARGMALKGKKYKAILAAYYSGAAIHQI